MPVISAEADYKQLINLLSINRAKDGNVQDHNNSEGVGNVGRTGTEVRHDNVGYSRTGLQSRTAGASPLLIIWYACAMEQNYRKYLGRCLEALSISPEDSPVILMLSPGNRPDRQENDDTVNLVKRIWSP